ncbi:receptor-type tyrosine-protein phosphatase C-like isoform X1 [Channa argus]|uniref:receptor-type tyrosine-protein phosphatase C-like isoform X1 n=1 Tax=Channa argus TaxID=215402 RepID=UPI002945D99D|nr:hypothetical protein Q8A73_009137 [Channa argus]
MYYTCFDELNEPKKLSDLEPFTDYNCTGQIRQNDVNTNKTTAVRFRVDCDLRIDILIHSKTNTSTEFKWGIVADRCKEKRLLENFYYDCSCSHSHAYQTHSNISYTKPSKYHCLVTGLHPFTSYTCKVQPSYKNKYMGKPEEVLVTTEIGIPEDITKVTVMFPEHNVMTVNCQDHHSSFRFNGPDKIYIVRLRYGSESAVEIRKPTCDFEFKDLSYSTTYKVEVTAFNGQFESRPKTLEVDTPHKQTTIIRYLVSFIIITILVAVMFYITKIYRKPRQTRDDAKEDVMLELTAIYENAEPPGLQRKN